MSQIKKCTGKDGFQRMNYLYQACNLLATDSVTHHIASSQYANLLVNIAKKTVLRMDIPVKRTLCKGCRTLLLAGITGKVRIKKKNVVWTCLKCHTKKIFETKNSNYLPWTQKDESVVETLEFISNVKKKEEDSGSVK